MPCSTMRAIASMSSAVAGSFLAPRSPITYARTAPCGTCAPTSSIFSARSTASRYSGKCSQLHSMPSDSAAPGNVLDAFHETDEPVVLVGLGRREADAAVAHDDRGHAVPAARREQRVPGDLAVEVRVHVDEARA